MTNDLVARICREAELASRPGQMERLDVIAEQVSRTISVAEARNLGLREIADEHWAEIGSLREVVRWFYGWSMFTDLLEIPTHLHDVTMAALGEKSDEVPFGSADQKPEDA